ncbi:MAG TPA: hypothetical protein VGC89_17050 [Pyrinomonadaceae bacterium]|jgi:hypothetical protein
MMMTPSRKLLLPPLVVAFLLLAQGHGSQAQTEKSASAPKVHVTTPVNNLIRYGLGLTFIAGTVEGTDVKEVGISIRRVGTNEEWSPTKKGGSFVKGPTGKWLKTTLDENKWYAPTSKYSLPTFADLLPAGSDEMRYIIYAYATDRAGHRSEEEGAMIIVRR